jgi:hypothetical protein
MTARIGERNISAAGAGKFRVELDAVADIDHDEQRGTALSGGQRTGVLFGLALGLEHGLIPKGAAAEGSAFFVAFALALPASERASSCSRFSTPCLASRTKQPRLYKSIRPVLVEPSAWWKVTDRSKT